MRRLKRSLIHVRSSWRKFPPLLFVALIASLVLFVFAFSGASGGEGAAPARKTSTTTTPPVTNPVPFMNPHASVRVRGGPVVGFAPHRIVAPPKKPPAARRK